MKSESTTTGSLSKILVLLFPDIAESEKAYDVSIIDGVRFMVIMEFRFCIESEHCTITS